MKSRNLFAILLLSTGTPAAPAFAQYCAYDDYVCLGNQRRVEQEERWRREAEDRQRAQDEEDRRRSDEANAAEQTRTRALADQASAQRTAESGALRARLLAQPPLPDERNPLLGRWSSVSLGRPAASNDGVAALLGLAAELGTLTCTTLFGEGPVTVFSPTEWSEDIGGGRKSFWRVQYRALGGTVFVIPPPGTDLYGFTGIGNNRIRETVATEGCVLERAGPASAGASAQPRPAPTASAPRVYPTIEPRSALGRGIALYRDGDLQQSLSFLAEATRASPGDPRGYAYLGAAYYKLGMTAESNAARDRALALDPNILGIVR